MGEPYLFTGSSDGVLRALRVSDGGNAPELVGAHESESLGFFALGPRLPSGDLVLFVTQKGSLSALRFDPTQGTFRQAAEVPTSGSGTHVSVTTRSGGVTSVLLAHYHEHRVSLFDFFDGDEFGAETTFEPGQHPHQTTVAEGTLLIPCLGSDFVAIYPWQGDLSRPSLPLASIEPGRVPVPGGPRHLTVWGQRRLAFVLCELTSRLECLRLDGVEPPHRLEEWSTPTHPDGGGHWSSDLALTPDATRLCALNRDPAELVVFTLEEGRAPEAAHRVPLTAPIRSFSMDPHGACLHLGGEDGVLHAISLSGAPHSLGKYAGFGPLRHTARVDL